MTNRKLKFSPVALSDSDASDGTEVDIGSYDVHYRVDGSSTTVANNDADGWASYGIPMNDLDLKPTIEAFEAMLGSPAKLKDKALIGKKLEFEITFMAARDITKALANGNKSVSYTEPASPITTTVDLNTFIPNHKSLVVAAVTGLAVGDEIIVKTGSTDNGQEWERLRITAIDTTAKQLFFEQKYQNIPEDGAAVKKIIGVKYENKGTTLPSDKIRIVKNDNAKNALTVFVFSLAKIEPSSRKLGTKAPSEVTLKFSIIPETKVTLRSGFNPLVENIWNTEEVIY